MPRPKKGDPELLLVSFCDIVTIVTAALFMAMIVVIDESSRIPVIRPTPLAHKTTNAPVFFECRNNQVYPVDFVGLGRLAKDALKSSMAAQIGALSSTNATEAARIKALFSVHVTNEYHHVNDGYLSMGVLALDPVPDAVGVTKEQLDTTSSNLFRIILATVDTNTQFVAFLVRDDSFPVFRKARDICTTKGYPSGWEYIGDNEPLLYGGATTHIGIQ